jgi:anaerobic magnesium-protoporphyrin IX monomethyl ester cyclase
MNKKARVLFVYPNERQMSTIPPAIALLSQLLKQDGHLTDIFDTTFYEFEDDIKQEDAEEGADFSLQHRPTTDARKAYLDNVDDDELHFKKNKNNAAEDLRKKIIEFKPDLLAVSCSETTFMRGLRLISKTRDLGVKNVFGGVFPTFGPHLVMNFDDVDMCCIGEGENAIVDLADRLANSKEYSDVTNLWVRKKDGTIKKNSITKPVDINKLPTITDIGIFGEKRFYRPMGGKIRRLLPVETHRGCPYTCSFCNSPSQNRLYADAGKSSFFRKKSMKLIKEEIENHIKMWKVEYIYFWADTFLAWSPKEFDEFCEMYKDIKLPFWCQTRIETISEEKFRKLKEVGLHRITFGMEHGNEKFRREVVKRSYTNKLAIELMKIPTELDITFSVNNIIGFPGETRELAFDTIELNRQFKSDDTSCSVLIPFHGTEIRKLAEKQNLIQKDLISAIGVSTESGVLDMPQWPKEEVAKLRNTFAMYVKFPKERWPEIKKAEDDPEIHAKLSAEFIDTYWSHRDDDLREAVKGLF